MARSNTEITEDAVPQADCLEGFPHPRERFRLTGHETAEQTLLEAHISGRLHHAWLLAGPKGIGKATLAYRFARILLKYQTPEAAAHLSHLVLDEDDNISRKIMGLAHPDFVVLRPGFDHKTRKLRQQIAIDDVRAAKNFLTKTSSIQNGWRICLVDAVDEMNTASANALLKMLEEPPEKAVFLLVAHAPGRLLATIRSRCRRLDLKSLSDEHIRQIVNELCQPAPCAGEEMEKLVLLAQGSAAKALAMTQNNGVQLYDSMINILETLPSLNLTMLHALAGKLSLRTGRAPQEFVLFGDLLCDWLARIARASVDGNPVTNPREAALITKLKSGNENAKWAQAWSEITHSLERANALNLERKQFVLQSFFNLEATARKN